MLSNYWRCKTPTPCEPHIKVNTFHSWIIQTKFSQLVCEPTWLGLHLLAFCLQSYDLSILTYVRKIVTIRFIGISLVYLRHWNKHEGGSTTIKLVFTYLSVTIEPSYFLFPFSLQNNVFSLDFFLYFCYIEKGDSGHHLFILEPFVFMA